MNYISGLVQTASVQIVNVVGRDLM